MNNALASGWLIAGNLAFFCLAAAYLLSRNAQLSHHWIFLLLETAFLAQAFTLKAPRLLKTLFFLSVAVLAVSLFRIETIYMSRHLVQFSFAWAAGGLVHLKLWIALRDSLLFRRSNAMLAFLCAATAAVSSLMAFRLGIWWGIGPGQ